MIAHVSIGVRDVEKSRAFYDAVLAPLGYKRIRAARSLVGYGYGAESISLWVVSAERPLAADEKSGLHFCFEAPNAAAVDTFYAAALGAGGRDNGTPRGRYMALITTPPSSSIRTATASKHIMGRARREGVTRQRSGRVRRRRQPVLDGCHEARRAGRGPRFRRRLRLLHCRRTGWRQRQSGWHRHDRRDAGPVARHSNGDGVATGRVPARGSSKSCRSKTAGPWRPAAPRQSIP